jgi:hypothetical protein
VLIRSTGSPDPVTSCHSVAPSISICSMAHPPDCGMV